MFRSSASFFIFCTEAMGWFIGIVWWYCCGFVLVFSFFVYVYLPFSSYWAEDDLISCCSLLGWLLPCFPITFYTPVCWYASVSFYWDWSIHQSIVSLDWFIDSSTDRSTDWLIDWLFAGGLWRFIPSVSFVGFTFRCPAPMSAVTLAHFCWPFVVV